MDALNALYITLIALALLVIYALGEGLFTLILFGITALVIRVFQGPEKASEYWSNSKRIVLYDVPPSSEANIETSTATNQSKSNDRNSLMRDTNRLGYIGCSLLFLSIFVTSWAVLASQRVKKQREEETHALVRKRVKDIGATWGAPPPHIDPKEGPLDDIDSWGNRLELLVDEALLGVTLTVRSAGPDEKTGTIDDVISVRVKPAKATDLGRDLGNRAADKLQSEWDGFKQRFGAKSEEMRQKIIDISNEQSGNGDASTPEDQTPE